MEATGVSLQMVMLFGQLDHSTVLGYKIELHAAFLSLPTLDYITIFIVDSNIFVISCYVVFIRM